MLQIFETRPEAFLFFVKYQGAFAPSSTSLSVISVRLI